MASNKVEDSEKKNPLKKVRAGRFQISIWVFRRLLSSGDKDSAIYLEKWVDVERACIQYSTYNKATGQWKNQCIWCSIDDLRSLAEAYDKLNDEDISSSDEVKGFSLSSEEKSQTR